MCIMRQKEVFESSESWTAAAQIRRSASTAPEQVEELIGALAEAGSSVLLTGEPGTGKSRIAQEVAYALAEQLGAAASVRVLIHPSHPMRGLAEFLGVDAPSLFEWDAEPDARSAFELEDPEQAVQRILDEIEGASGEGETILVASGIDEYSPVAAYLFARLVRSRRLRTIATAQHLTGAAALMASHPRTREMTIRPFTLEESARYLKQVLGCETIENRSLVQWHRLTAGNAYSLLLLMIALQQEGRVGRHRGVAWEIRGGRTVPEEFFRYLVDSCSPEELRVLEILAVGEPLVELPLLNLLDIGAVASLRRRGLVIARTMRDDAVALSFGSPLNGAALREHMPAARRAEIGERLFTELLEASEGRGAYASSTRTLRLVLFGLSAGRDLPFDWLWSALHARERFDEAWRCRVAMIVAAHPEATKRQRGVAALIAYRIARASGDAERLAEVLDLAIEASTRLRRSAVGALPEGVALDAELALHRLFVADDAAGALRGFEELSVRTRGEAPELVTVVESGRAYVTACTGELRLAQDLGDELEAAAVAVGPEGTAQLEWARIKARVVSALVRIQEGRFTEAMLIAEDAGHLAAFGERPMEEAELLGFIRFLAIWGSGSVEAGLVALREFEEQAHPSADSSGFAECGHALLHLSEGRWHLALREAERLQDRLAAHDLHGLRPLVHAVLALALAAIGEQQASERAIREAERGRRGLSYALLGLLRLLTLRARQWNHSPELETEARRLAAWAAKEGLASIELQALHIGALSDSFEFERMLPRMRVLAGQMDLPLGVAMLAHVEEFVSQSGAWESPSARTLAELGVWIPLPQTTELSAREREIALLASLGYSSRWIAEQFHLSVRTVETHLRHVFVKLGASNRDELRSWFRRERRQA